MNKYARLLPVLLCIAGFLPDPASGAMMSIVNSKHDLSRTSTAQIKAATEGRICVFCHTPHNANPLSPLWNKNIEGVNYTLYTPYTSSTLVSPPSPAGPTGATRLCLSCHDGTIALGQLLQPSQKITMTVAGGLPPTSPSYFGTSLAAHHPVSFSYYDANPGSAGSQLAPSPPAELLFYGNGVMQCTTCHDPHDNSNKKFLAVNNEYSGLCTLCHALTGWDLTSHSTSTAAWMGGGTYPWPRTGAGTDFGWTTVQRNGCENCHSPHRAAGEKRLLNYAHEENNCYPCHNGKVAADIEAQFRKPSRHRIESYLGVHDPKTEQQNPLVAAMHVECVDCHNPHASNAKAASPPTVSGRLEKVSGVDINGAGLTPPAEYAANEYEICFKCHASSSPQTIAQPIPRVAKSVNTRIAFQTINPSYHPVVGVGRNLDVPSIPSADAPNLTAASVIYCTDCHDSDESRSIGGAGPRGPHGSLNSPLIRERYETVPGTIESTAVYALCYRCHNRNSILNDASFGKNGAGNGGHSRHIQGANAPCSICHDPHGVQDDLLSGSHTHLINFDTRYVTPVAGNAYPFFTDSGSRSGSCTLVCHGVAHDGSSRFSYGGAIRIRW